MKGSFQVRFLEGGGWQQPASTRRYTGGLQGGYRGFTGGKAPAWEAIGRRKPCTSQYRRNRALWAASGRAFAICTGLDYVLARFGTMKTQFRSESDSMGEVRVPADAYYGAQTERAVENFPISRMKDRH